MSAARIEYIALAALAGNLLAHQLPALPAHPLALSLVLGGLTLCCRRRTLVAGIALVSFGATVMAAAARIADRWSDAAAAADLEISGWVDDFPRVDGGRAVFTLRTAPADRSAGLPGRVRLTWYEADFLPQPGQSLRLTVRLRPPRGLANPGGFDYERWLLTEAIGATGYVRRCMPEPARDYGLAQSWLALRHRIAQSITATMSDAASAALVTALGVGARADFADAQWTTLRRTGTSHLVAISGLHIGLIALFAFLSLRSCALRLPYAAARRAWTLAAGGSLLAASGYAALAGFALPTVRALLMLAVAQAVVVSRRRVAPLTALSLALLVVLLVDPLATLGASFWLSFAAVGVIVLFLSRAGARHEDAAGGRARFSARARRAAGSLVAVQIGVSVGLTPIAAFFFGEISIAGLPVNLVAVPFFSFVLVPVSLLLTIAALTGSSAELVARFAETLAHSAWLVLESVAAWPYASVEVRSPGAAAAAFATVGAGMLLNRRIRMRLLGALACLPLLLRVPERPDAGNFSLTVLDVGHGLAVVVQTARHTLLYDAGPVARSGFDAGREVVVPALRSFGTAELSALIVSHGDGDHAGGLDAVLDRYMPESLLAGPDVDRGDVMRCAAGQRWNWDGVTFSILHPEPGFRPHGNDSSCVLRIDATGGGSALLTGDIERRGEASLTGAALERADIVIAPHHGSATSSSVAFVNATRPSHVIVSAAYANRWNFPRPEVVSRWQSIGATILTTGERGAITAHVAAAGVRMETWRENRFRYWNAASGAGTSSGL